MHLKYHFEKTKLGDKVIAVPVGEDVSFHGAVKMNKTAAEIFELLKQDTTEEEIVETLSSRYDVPKEQLEADVRTYIGQFMDRGMIAL